MASALSLSAILVIVIVIVVVTARVTLPAGRMLARNNPCGNRRNLLSCSRRNLAAAIPDRVRKHLDAFHRRHGIVALDHQLARARTFFAGAVLNDDRKTRARAAVSPGMDC